MGFDAAVSRRWGSVALTVFAVLFALPLLGQAPGSGADVLSTFHRAGALVFGGGHVVMPLLDTGVVAPGWLSQDDVLAGCGAVQAAPGSLFTFAGYLGAAMAAGPGGWIGGVLALLAIFLPSLLLAGRRLNAFAVARRRACDNGRGGVGQTVASPVCLHMGAEESPGSTGHGAR